MEINLGNRTNDVQTVNTKGGIKRQRPGEIRKATKLKNRRTARRDANDVVWLLLSPLARKPSSSLSCLFTRRCVGRTRSVPSETTDLYSSDELSLRIRGNTI